MATTRLLWFTYNDDVFTLEVEPTQFVSQIISAVKKECVIPESVTRIAIRDHLGSALEKTTLVPESNTAETKFKVIVLPAAFPALRTQGKSVSIWLRFYPSTGIAKTPFDPLDASSWKEFVKKQRQILQRANVLDATKPVNIFYREDAAGIRGRFQPVNETSFNECLRVSGKFYITQLHEVSEKDISVETLPEPFHSDLFVEAADRMLPGDEISNYYSKFTFLSQEQRNAAVSIHRLLQAGVSVIFDEIQVSATALKTVITATSMRSRTEKGSVIIIGTPRLGASKLPSGDRNDENKIYSMLQIKRLDVVEILAYAEKVLDRNLTSLELAYLYVFTGGHLRELCSILNNKEEDILNASQRLHHLQYARDRHLERFTKSELAFLTSCVGQNESGARAPPNEDVIKLMFDEAIIYAAPTLRSSDTRNLPRYKISDPLLASMLKLGAANIGPNATSQEINSVIGVIVESAVDEILDRIGTKGGTVKGIDLTGFKSYCLSMKQNDIDTILIKSADDGNIVDAIFINTKLNGSLFSDTSISNFMEKNVKSARTLLPANCPVTVRHLSITADIPPKTSTPSTEFWTLDDLIEAAAAEITTARHSIKLWDANSEKSGKWWFGRPDEEERIRDWMSREGCQVLRLTGHAGNGKTELVCKLMDELKDQKRIVYIDLLRHYVADNTS